MMSNLVCPLPGRRLGRASAVDLLEDRVEFVTHLVLWACSWVVIACGFARLLP